MVSFSANELQQIKKAEILIEIEIYETNNQENSQEKIIVSGIFISE
jgi:hypothetical protein